MKWALEYMAAEMVMGNEPTTIRLTHEQWKSLCQWVEKNHPTFPVKPDVTGESKKELYGMEVIEV